MDREVTDRRHCLEQVSQNAAAARCPYCVVRPKFLGCHQTHTHTHTVRHGKHTERIEEWEFEDTLPVVDVN